MCGPWVREFGYYHNGAEGTRVGYLESVIHRLSNLQIFCSILFWESEEAEDDEDDRKKLSGFENVFDSFTGTTSLQTIWVHESLTRQNYLADMSFLPLLCDVLPTLTSLSSLSVPCHSLSVGDDFWDHLQLSSPPVNLNTLRINITGIRSNDESWRILLWLIRPRGDFALRELDIVGTYEYNETAVLDLLPNCSSVEVLGLSPWFRGFEEEEFRARMQYDPRQVVTDHRDEALRSSIARLSRLHTLKLGVCYSLHRSYYKIDYPYNYPRELETCIPQSSALCQDNGIALHLHIPSGSSECREIMQKYFL